MTHREEFQKSFFASTNLGRSIKDGEKSSDEKALNSELLLLWSYQVITPLGYKNDIAQKYWTNVKLRPPCFINTKLTSNEWLFCFRLPVVWSFWGDVTYITAI